MDVGGSGPRSLHLFDKIALPPEALVDRVFIGAPEIHERQPIVGSQLRQELCENLRPSVCRI
jgi:hypothetical protein